MRKPRLREIKCAQVTQPVSGGGRTGALLCIQGLPAGSTTTGHVEPGGGAGPLGANTAVGEVTSSQLVAGGVREGHMRGT